MKQSIATIIFIFCVSFNLQAQVKKDIDFIISIDEKLPISSIHKTKIIANMKDGSEKIINIDYSPGSLGMNSVDFDKLLSSEVKSFWLKFNYTEICKKNNIEHTYEIELKKGWLKHYYFVLKVYNTDKKKYKKLFTPLLGKNYTYEYYYPGGQVLRVTKKKRKECCK
ncbi:MAG: hypothetical protein COA88_13045 [Kordia sp.]|nr:MAG: hypothetical protein COA88_13045 [Kordia sp.]